MRIFVRYLPHVVSQARRVVHVVLIPHVDEVPEELVAYCGERIKPGTAEQLSAPTGAPCVVCMFATTPPAAAQPLPRRIPGEYAQTLHTYRTLAAIAIFVHRDVRGHCAVCDKPSPCKPLLNAAGNLQFLST